MVQLKHFKLSGGDLEEFRRVFKVGNIWSRLRDDGEAMRFWHVLSETPSGVRMHHGTGAVALLTVKDDRILDVMLLQGSEAEEVLRKEGLRISGENRAKAGKYLRRSRIASVAMNDAWPSGRGLQKLPCEASGSGELLRFRLSWSGVLEVETDSRGRIESYRFHEGGAAIDLIRNVQNETGT